MPRTLNRNHRHTSAVAAATVALITVLSACSGGDSSDGAAQGTDALKFAIQTPPNSLDPSQLTVGENAFIWSALYDTLLYMDNNGELKPNAAESWKYSDDRRTLTLKLREDLTFSNGGKVDANAVKATVEHTMRTPGPSRALFKSVDKVEAFDKRTVVFSLTKPDAVLLYALAAEGGVIADPKTVDDKRTVRNPVSSGPYVLDEAKTEAGTVFSLKRRDNHWNADAFPFRTVDIRLIRDPGAYTNALQSGQLNAGSVRVEDQARVKAAGFTGTEVKANSLAMLVIGDRAGEVEPALGDVRVRKAIAMAFDREKIIKQLLKGVGEPATQQFSPGGPAHDPELGGLLDYDPQQAKKFLAEAGYPDGFSLRMPEIIYAKPFVPTITQSLADIGIEVKWDAIPPQRTYNAYSSKKYPVYFTVESANAFPRELNWHIPTNTSHNPWGTRDPKLDDLMAKYHAEPDTDRGTELAKEMNGILTREVWDAPLFTLDRQWFTKDGITVLNTGKSSVPTLRWFGVSGEGADR
ncbi:ABC transporter substrate-binding protein [Streptomyces mutabilis]|uniref:ABC transporter substrate-binding protein n=1 Tax=Streptomyces mutabilis TaxID=67332 RepID=UPI0017854EB0|nr:ABC transporter substrate-binding protein [Streptomyces mutabilis]GGQ33222.1 peptide ABC transporter substrate-binding protein [Streptomyces mutabilis]